MSSRDLKKNIQLAKDAVEGESEPYKTEAFKIILSKLIDSNFLDINTTEKVAEIKNSELDESITERTKEFAYKCNITVEELNDVISLNGKTIEIITPLQGSDAEKHLTVALVVLATNEIILNREWTSATEVAECLRSLGVRDLANLAKTLRKHSGLIRTKGIKRNKEYRLTSSEGRIVAFDTIHRLAKGEFDGNIRIRKENN